MFRKPSLFRKITPYPQIQKRFYPVSSSLLRGLSLMEVSTGTNEKTGDKVELIKPLHDGSVYNNPWSTWSEVGFTKAFKFFGEIIKMQLSGQGKVDFERLEAACPVVQPDMKALDNPPHDNIQVTWLGHASSLVQMEGVNFLTDPVWAHRVSPLSWLGPKRLRGIAIPLDKHNHYDHLDAAVVDHIGNKALWMVPMGLKQWFVDRGINNVVELSWWESHQFNDDIKIWSSWSIIGSKKRVWFSGDTGYCPVFKSIGAMYGPYDLSLIAIGAYCPRDFMRAQHVDPAEAVKMHMELQSKKSIGIHWGTYQLTTEPMDEPPQLLAKELSQNGLRSDEFVVTKIGEVVDLGKPVASKSEATLENID